MAAHFTCVHISKCSQWMGMTHQQSLCNPQWVSSVKRFKDTLVTRGHSGLVLPSLPEGIHSRQQGSPRWRTLGRDVGVLQSHSGSGEGLHNRENVKSKTKLIFTRFLPPPSPIITTRNTSSFYHHYWTR